MTRIVSTDDVLGGEPRLESRRISVVQIADMVLEGDHSPEYVADQLDISLADVHGALSYYYEHPDEIEAVRERHRKLEERLSDVSSRPDKVEQ